MAEGMYLTFADLVEGTVYPLQVPPISRDEAHRYYEVCGFDTTDRVVTAVPPLMLTLIRHLKSSLPAPWPPGGLHVSDTTRVLGPVPFDQSLSMSTTVISTYERRDRKFVELEIVVTVEQQDVLTCHRRMTWAA